MVMTIAICKYTKEKRGGLAYAHDQRKVLVISPAIDWHLSGQIVIYKDECSIAHSEVSINDKKVRYL